MMPSVSKILGNHNSVVFCANDADADTGKLGIQDVALVAFAFHESPVGRRHIRRLGEVFSGNSKRDTRFFQTLPRILSFGIDMRKIAAGKHIAAMRPGHFRNSVVKC